MSDIYKVTACFLPPSKRCQDPRRLRVVGTYLQGGEWRRYFPQDKKDAKVFQKIVGATNLVMENNEASQKQEETFYIYIILRATYIYNYFFSVRLE